MISPISASVHVASLQNVAADGPAATETGPIAPPGAAVQTETVSLGDEAHALAHPQEAGAPIDMARINRLRAAIAMGTYQINHDELTLRLAQSLSEMRP